MKAGNLLKGRGRIGYSSRNTRPVLCGIEYLRGVNLYDFKMNEEERGGGDKQKGLTQEVGSYGGDGEKRFLELEKSKSEILDNDTTGDHWFGVRDRGGHEQIEKGFK